MVVPMFSVTRVQLTVNASAIAAAPSFFASFLSYLR